MYDSTYNVNDIVRLPSVWFNFYKCTLLANKDSVFNQDDTLRPVVKFINEHPTFTFELRAHTDTVDPKASTRFTSCRAKSVLERLVELGADGARLVSRGMGESEPLMLDQTLYLPSGDSLTEGVVLTHRFIARYKYKKDDWEFLRRQNRRIDLKIITIDYVAPVDTTK